MGSVKHLGMYHTDKPTADITTTAHRRKFQYPMFRPKNELSWISCHADATGLYKHEAQSTVKGVPMDDSSIIA